MANPQIENGYVRIATELIEALAKTNIPSSSRQVLDFVIRKTYGYHKKSDKISISQIAEGTGLSERQAWRAKADLIDRNIITPVKNDRGIISTLAVNKNHETWRQPLTRTVRTPDKKWQKPLTGMSDTIDIKIITIDKDTEGPRPPVDKPVENSTKNQDQAIEELKVLFKKEAEDPEIERDMKFVYNQLQNTRQFNIYAFIGKHVHETNRPVLPSVIIKVARSAIKTKPTSLWGYFRDAVKVEMDQVYVEKKLIFEDAIKKQPVSPAIAEIMRGIFERRP